MKKEKTQIKHFKKFSKFLGLKSLNPDVAFLANKNLLAKSGQLAAIDHKLVRKFKNEGFYVHLNTNKNLTKKALGSKLGSGKGKFLLSVSAVKKYQPVLKLRQPSCLTVVEKTLTSFTRFIKLNLHKKNDSLNKK
jgi:ribosomal protein L16/L10AE